MQVWQETYYSSQKYKDQKEKQRILYRECKEYREYHKKKAHERYDRIRNDPEAWAKLLNKRQEEYKRKKTKTTRWHR